MTVDWQHMAELALMALVNGAATLGGIKARLRVLEKRDDDQEDKIAHVNERIDDLLLRGDSNVRR